MRDLTGCKFGRLTVAQYSHRVGQQHLWLTVCECGKQQVVYGSNLTRGHTQSCGCLQVERASFAHIGRVYRATNLRHGMSNSPTFRAWGGAKNRCLNPKNKKYKIYGARGIKICERWMRFENFLADMGIKPPGTSLGRIDNNGNYEPGNCRWETPLQQANNTRTNRFIQFNGETRTLAEWARLKGLGRATLALRVKKQWPPEKLFWPAQPMRKPRKGWFSNPTPTKVTLL